MSADEEPLERAKAQTKSYLRYSGLGFQMAALIGLGTWLGWWIDGRTSWDFPLFTILGSLGSIAIAMLLLFKETARKDR